MKPLVPLLIIVVISCIIITVLTFYFYFQVFDSTFSDQNSDWGDFGSYISGILGTFAAFLNAFAFIFLTILLYKSQNEQNKKKNLSPFLINAMSEMIRMELIGLSALANKPLDKGTVKKLKIEGSHFILCYSTYLEKAGVQIDQIKQVFKSIKSIEALPVKTKDGLEYELVSDENYKLAIGAIAGVMRAQIERIEIFLFE